MRLTAVGASALLVILGAGAALVGVWRDGAAVAQGAPPAPPTVTVARPLRQPIVEWDEFTGRFEAVERVELRARVSGYLASVHFEDGQLVERGDLLFVIDRRPFELMVAEARAGLDAARATLELARIEVARAERLLGTPALPRATYDQRVQQVLEAQAQVEQTRATLMGAELDLGFTEVRAPVNGRISDRRVDVGNLVSDATLLTTVVALNPIHFVFDMNEADFLAYQRASSEAPGGLRSTRDRDQVVNVNLVDETGWQREGRMNFVDNVVDQGTGTVRARAIVTNDDLLIAPGQFGRIRIPGSPLYEAVLIPDEAIVTDQSQKLVMVVADDGTVSPRVIRPGPRELGLRVVRAGLDGSERIVINGLVRVRPGGKVTPEEGVIRVAVEQAAAGAVR
jgi:RND family efflux transporter MFP subunit